MNEKLGPLEVIQTKIGCFYLSDLRMDPQINNDAWNELLKLNFAEYSNQELKEAIVYLFGKRETNISN